MEKYNAVYARQSVEKKDSLSIDGQIDLCRKAADEELHIYKDAGYSGKNTQRPDFQRLIADIQADKIGKLYVYRLDRFSRSVADFGRLWEILKAHGVEFVSVSENFDTTSPMGRAMLHIIMVFAQLERETTAERVKDNYYRRAALGAWPGGPAPYGFQIGKMLDEAGRTVSTLTIDPDSASIVRRIYEEYAKDGTSLRTIASQLTEEGIPAPRRSFWDNVTLSRILHNPVYVMADEQVRLYYHALGTIVTSAPEDFDGIHGLSLYGKRDRSARKYTDVHDHRLSVLNSLGFIPSDLWLQCQQKLSQNRQLSREGKGKYSWLTGLMKCADCGYSIKINCIDGKLYMICSGRSNYKICSASIKVQVAELEASVSAAIQSMLDECPTEPLPEEQDTQYTKQLDELDRKAQRLLNAFAESDSLTGSYLRKAIAQIEQERQELQARHSRETKRTPVPDKLVFNDLAFEDKKKVAARFIRRIELVDDKANVVWEV